MHYRFAKSDKAILEDFNKVEAFGKLLKAAGEVAEQHAEMPAADVTAMYIALAQFTASVYPDRLDFVDLVLTSCYQVYTEHVHGKFSSCSILLSTQLFM